MSQNIDKKVSGKSGKQSAVSQTLPSSTGIEKKVKRRPFTKDGEFSISKIKHNIKRVIKTAEKYSKDRPSVSNDALVCLATIAINLAKTISTTAGDCSKKIGKATVGREEVMAAIEIELKGELRLHCVEDVKTNLSKAALKK